MTPRDRRKLAEAVAERVPLEREQDRVPLGRPYPWETYSSGPALLRICSDGTWGIQGRDWQWVWTPRLTGRNWLPRTADAIADAVRAAEASSTAEG